MIRLDTGPLFTFELNGVRAWVELPYWFEKDGKVATGSLSVYMRPVARDHVLQGFTTTIDIANITASHRGHGAFTAMLDYLEPRFGIYVENIANPRLPVFLRKRGYVDVSRPDALYPPCYARKKGPCNAHS